MSTNDKQSYQQLVEVLMDLVMQGQAQCLSEQYRRPWQATGDKVAPISVVGIIEYRAAFDVLERLGKLEYLDEDRYWARLK